MFLGLLRWQNNIFPYVYVHWCKCSLRLPEWHLSRRMGIYISRYNRRPHGRGSLRTTLSSRSHRFLTTTVKEHGSIWLTVEDPPCHSTCGRVLWPLRKSHILIQEIVSQSTYWCDTWVDMLSEDQKLLRCSDQSAELAREWSPQCCSQSHPLSPGGHQGTPEAHWPPGGNRDKTAINTTNKSSFTFLHVF